MRPAQNAVTMPPLGVPPPAIDRAIDMGIFTSATVRPGLRLVRIDSTSDSPSGLSISCTIPLWEEQAEAKFRRAMRELFRSNEKCNGCQGSRRDRQGR